MRQRLGTTWFSADCYGNTAACLLLAIGSIVIRRDSEQTDEIPVTVRRRPARLGDEYLKNI